MTEKNIIDCFDNVVPTDIQKRKMLNNILEQGGNLSMKKTRRFTGRAIAAIVAAVILVVGGAVATIHFWTDAEVAYQLMQGDEIVVNGVIIDAPAPYITAENDENFLEAVNNYGLSMVMVPLEPIVAELGIGVSVPLPTEAVVQDGYTFVPLTFIRDELDVLQVYVFEGQVVIENRPEFVMM
ncbi:MAG: hypothetical protein FWE04_08080 [Oscillospiraceae bacterium]|nr:hypothetical protein [Oscillospiraceae bacterium]